MRLKAVDNERRRGSFVTLLTVLASFFVAKRLWDQHVELAKLRDFAHGVGEQRSRVRDASSDRKTRGGEMDPNTESQTLVGCARQEPVFYSVRPKTSTVVTHVKGIGVSLPVGKGAIITMPPSTSSIASVDSVEAGHVTGWACHRSSKGFSMDPPSAHVYAVVDGTVVASVDVTKMVDDISADVAEICSSRRENVEPDSDDLSVFRFDIGLPPLPLGVHELRVLIDDASSSRNNSSSSALDVTSSSLVEAFHSPLKFEESVNELSMAAMIKRKDEIITHRNNILTKLWNEVQTQLPWRRYERDAEDMPMDGLNESGQDDPDLLAVILVRSDPAHSENRDAIRNTWGGRMNENKMMVRFIMDGQFLGPHKDAIGREMNEHGDIISVKLPANESDGIDRMLFGLNHAVKHHDASFYFVVSDRMLIVPSNLRKYLLRKLNGGNFYMGCMKSGEIEKNESKSWYEPEHWRFGKGDQMVYPQHARTAMYGFSRFIARYLARSREILHKYSNEDTTIGTWMLGLDVEYEDNWDFCREAFHCTAAGAEPIGVKDRSCDGVCHIKKMREYWTTCAREEYSSGKKDNQDSPSPVRTL